MFSEIVKLTPKLDPAAMRQMFQTLNQRFTAVAKKFGQGMKNAFKFSAAAGGIAALGTALISRFLNPLEKAEEVINRILDKGDDAQTNAEEFGTTPGKLLRLQALAQTKGLDADTLRTLLGKFQGALADEKEKVKAPADIQKRIKETTDPTQKAVLQNQLTAAQAEVAKGGTLREFVNEKDIADAFFTFIQSLQDLDPSRRTVVQSEVFGEKIRGKASEFFNAKDFAEILAKLPSAARFDEAAKKTGELADKRDLLRSITESEDFLTKSTLVKESQVNAIDQSQRMDMRGENESLQRFDSLKTSSIAIQELTHKFDKFATDFIKDVAPQLVIATNEISRGLTVLMPLFVEAKDLLTNGFNKTIDTIATLSNSIDTYWGQFTQSRVYKFFGGK